MIFKLSVVAAVLVSFSAHAEVQCERSKRDVSLNGEVRTERLVNIRQNGQKIITENFDQDIAYRDAAADACARALAASRCEAIQIPAKKGFEYGNRFKTFSVKGSLAHVGAVNTATAEQFDTQAECEESRIDLASDALDAVKSEFRAKRARLNAERAQEIRYQNELSGRTPKL